MTKMQTKRHKVEVVRRGRGWYVALHGVDEVATATYYAGRGWIVGSPNGLERSDWLFGKTRMLTYLTEQGETDAYGVIAHADRRCDGECGIPASMFQAVGYV